MAGYGKDDRLADDDSTSGAYSANDRPAPPDAPDIAKPGALRSVADSALALGTGVVQGAQALTNIAGAGNRVSRGLADIADAGQRLLSPYRQQELRNRQQRIEEAEAGGSTLDEVGAYLGGFAEAPLDTTLNFVGSSVPTLAAAVLSRGRVAAPTIGTAQGVGEVKGNIYEASEQKALDIGYTPEQAQAIADQAQAYSGENLDQQLVGGALGAFAGSTGAERVARALVGKTAIDQAEGTLRRVGTGALAEAIPEGLQEGQGRLASNLALQRQGYEDVGLSDGVAGSAALGAVAGGALGGGLSIPRASRPEQDDPPGPEQEEPGGEPFQPPPSDRPAEPGPQSGADLGPPAPTAEQPQADPPAPSAGDAIRATKVAEVGPLSRSVNTLVEREAQAADAGAGSVAPVASALSDRRAAAKAAREQAERTGGADGLGAGVDAGPDGSGRAGTADGQGSLDIAGRQDGEPGPALPAGVPADPAAAAADGARSRADAPSLTTREQPAELGAKIDARPAGTRGTTAGDVLPRLDAAAPAPQPAADAGTAAPPVAAAPELVPVRSRFGNTVYVRSTDLSSDKARMRYFTSTGKTRGVIARENLDPTGEKQAAENAADASNPLFDTILTMDGAAFASKLAATREMNQRGLKESHAVVAAPRGGFVIQRRTAQSDLPAATSTDTAPAQAGAPASRVATTLPTPQAPLAAAAPSAAGSPGSAAGSDDPATAAAPAGKRGTLAERRAQAQEAKRADYFAAGNVVRGYGGLDRVLAYRKAGEGSRDGQWEVQVQRVIKQGDEYVPAPNERPRWHSTEPDQKELSAGPVRRAPANEPTQRARSGAQEPVQNDRMAAFDNAAVSANTIFTEDAAAAARARLKAKLGRVQSGIDPETLMDGITLAGYHIEKGARTFAAYAKAMIADLGDGVKPYLKSWYMAVRADPRATTFAADMDRASAVEDLDVDAVLREDAPPAADTTEEPATNGAQDATRPLDRTGPSALGGVPPGDVRPSGQEGDAGRGTARRSRSDGQGDADLGGSGGDAVRGLGGGEAEPSVPRPRGRRDGRADGGQRGLRGGGRSEPEPGLFDDAGRTGDLAPGPSAAPIEAPAFKPQDFTITDELALGEGGQKTKYRINVEAIRLLKALDAAGRPATPDEQKTLALYVGWGGIPQAFDGQNENWSREHAELKELLTPDEYADARQSTQYAHYTSREVIGGVYSALKRFGFTGGRVLEPGSGVGNFMGLMPSELRSASRFTAVEREPIAAGIARHLYPQQNVQRADFTEFVGADEYFDAAIGNPPFSSTTLTDASGRKHLSGLSVHNYFFAKAVDQLREGGVLAMVVSNSFMDARGDLARRYIAERTKLLGAIRLPNNAFSKNANTEVTTDIVFLQKRPESEWGGKAAMEDARRWLGLADVKDELGGADIPVNRYFAENPQMLLGSLGRYGTMYGPGQPALTARPGQDTAALLAKAIESLPQGVYTPPAVLGTDRLAEQTIVALSNPQVQEGGYYAEGGKLYQRLTDVAGESRARELTPATQWTEKTALGDTGFQRLVALSQMRRTLRDLLASELNGDAGMEALRKTLNDQYDAYTKAHGLINDAPTARLFDDDPDFPLLASLEHGYTPGMGLAAARRQGIKPYKSTAKKAPIFSQRVVDARKQVRKVETPADALAVSIAERGRIDNAYIAELLGRDADEVLKELASGGRPLLFLDPATNEYVLRDAYLSGNVRAKLVQARQSGMFANAQELEKVQPEDVGADQIQARIGSPWVPESVYEQFAQELFGEGTKASVRYVKLNSSFTVGIRPGSDTANTNTWGTAQYPGDALLSALLNNREIKVTWRDDDGKTHVDQEATDQANVKAQDIRNRFQDWLFTDGDRAEVLMRAYNDTNNNYVVRNYDGSWMTFPGKVPDSIIKFRRHQRNAIARIVQDRTALLDHVVGAGKTFIVVSAAMELKRTGLAKKPLIVVPNHLVKQWAADFYRLYPGANILTATKKDFAKANRRKFLAKIATGDWDAVVMAHSSFGFIKPAPDFEAGFNGQQVKSIVDTIEAVEAQDGDDRAKKRTVKQLEGLKERLENRIKSLRQKPLDNLLDFEQIGVDQLFVDEAHLFKNLMFTTKMQNIRGLGDSKGSQRAYDMFVKVNELYAKNGRGQGVVFATGTPVSNSLAEMYHMMRYLMPKAMEDMGFQSFDAWANTFAGVSQEWDQKSSGDGFKAINTMSSFVNTHELLRVFDQVADTVTMDDIKSAFRDENQGKEFPLPALKTGRRQPVSLVKSDAQDAYMREIAQRAAKLEQKNGPPQKGEDNALVIMTDARKAAMDIRLVNPTITEREKGGRIDRAAENIVARWQQSAAVNGTQLVFSDLGTPIKTVKDELKEYEALQARIAPLNDEDVVASAQLGDEAALNKLEDAEAAQEELSKKGGDWLTAIQSALRGFSVYDDLKAALIERGIPENEIAFIHDFNTDEQKAALFRKVNAGQIRVLLGSTAKMGAGTNVQERLVALHHLDVPWKPSDIEQREGRIIRQGNRLQGEVAGFEVEILAYVTQDTLDMKMWMIQERKLKMINQLRARQIDREIENSFEDMEMSAGEMQAAATGNMDLLREIQLRTDVKKLEQRKRAFDAQRNDLQSRRRRAERDAADLPKQIERHEPAVEALGQYRQSLQERADPKATINGAQYASRAQAMAALRELTDAHEARLAERNARIAADDKLAPADVPMPKLAVEFNGTAFGSKAALAEAASEFYGDADPIAWVLHGSEMMRRSAIVRAIMPLVAEASATDTERDIGAIGPFKVTVEGQRSRMGDKQLDVVVAPPSGEPVSTLLDIAKDLDGDALARSASSNVLRAVESMVNGARGQLDYLRHRLDSAQRSLAELDRTQMADAWPDADKLEKARAEHREVLARLSSATAATKPGGDGESLSIVESFRQDSAFPVDAATQGAQTAGYARPSRTHADLAARLQERLRAGVLPGVVFDAVAARVGEGAGRRDRELAAVSTVARRIFGHEAVFLSFRGAATFNGVASDAIPGTVFLNAEASRPLMAVLGHELLHKMRAEQPTTYAALVNRLQGLLRNENAYTERLKAKYEAAGVAWRQVRFAEELHADIVGDFFMDPQFWQALGADRPGLFRRVVNAVLKFLDDAAARIGAERPFGTEEFLSDIATAREAVASAMREFGGAQTGRGARTDGINLSVNDGSRRDAGVRVRELPGAPSNSRFVVIATGPSNLGGETHVGYYATEQDANEAAERYRAIVRRGAGKAGVRWWVANRTELLQSAGVGSLDSRGRQQAARQTLNARRDAVRSPEEGLQLTQIADREGLCFACAAEAAASYVGNMTIGASPDGRGSLMWHAVVTRDGMVYDPTFGRWFEPGVYEALGFQPRKTLTSDDVREFIAMSGGFAPDPINQGMGRAPGDDAGEQFSIADALQAGVNNARDLNLPAGYKLGDLFQSTGRLSWWDKTVGTPYNLARRYPDTFGQVFNGVQNFLADVSRYANEAANKAPSILPKLEELKDIAKSPLSAEDTRAIAAPIFEGTLRWLRTSRGDIISAQDAERQAASMSVEDKAQELLRADLIDPKVLRMWRGLPLDQYEAAVSTRYQNSVLRPGVVWTDAELRQRFKMTDRQLGLYREFRAATDESLRSLAVSEMVRLAGEDGAGIDAMSMSAMDASKALRDRLFDLAGRQPERAAALNAAADGIVQIGNRIDDLGKRGYAPLTRFGHYTLDVVDAAGERVYFGMFDSEREANKMARRMRAEFPGAALRQGTQSAEAYRLFQGVSPETIELFGDILGLSATGDRAQDAAFQEYLKRATATRSALKRLIHRKGTAGFSEDAGRVLASFLTSNARRASSNLHRGATMKAAENIPQGQGELKDYAVKMSEYASNPQEEAQAVRGLMFAHFLGGSVASAMVNMTQPIAVSFPYLSQFGGVRQSAAQLTRAFKDMADGRKLEPDLAAAIQRAEEDGVVSPQEIFQLMAQAQGRGGLQAGDGTVAGDAAAKANNAVTKLQLAWGKLFGWAEQVNRRSTYIAAYRIAKAQGMADPAKFAADAVVETQFTYNRGNKPQWARGAIGATIFTFKTYSISYVEMMARLARSGPEGRRALALGMGVMLLMAGTDELPFMEDAEDVIDGVAQRVLGLDWSTKQRRNEWLVRVFGGGATGRAAQEFIAKGISGVAGVPIDLSGRLGMGNLLPGTGILQKKADYSRDALEILGPAGSLVQSYGRSAAALTQGEIGKAIQEASPLAAQNAIKAGDMLQTGLYRDTRGRKVIDTETWEAAVKALGFQPNSVARVQDAAFQVQRSISLNKVVESELADLWARGIFEGDAGKIDRAKSRLRAWNESNPNSRIGINLAQLRRRVQAMREDRATRLASTAPQEIRGRVREALAEAP